jgi:hypothetical protein
MMDRAEDNEEAARVAEEVGNAFIKAFTKRPRYAVLSESGEVITCDLLTWTQNLHGRHRIIAQEDLEGGYWISTVFLGLDHSYNPKGPQMWFETMIFEPPTGEDLALGRPHGEIIYCDRYSTRMEALAGHEAAKYWFSHERDED